MLIYESDIQQVENVAQSSWIEYHPKQHLAFDGVMKGVTYCWLHIDLADHGHQGKTGEASIEPKGGTIMLRHLLKTCKDGNGEKDAVGKYE